MDIRHILGRTNVAWKKTSDCSFTVKSAYTLLSPKTLNPMKYLWRVVWKWKGPKRVKSFLWTLAHDNIPTNEMFAVRGMDSDGMCPWCGVEWNPTYMPYMIMLK